MFANSVKRHICGGKKIATKACLPSSVDDRVISPFLEGFIFTKLRSFAKFQLSRIFPNLQYL